MLVESTQNQCMAQASKMHYYNPELTYFLAPSSIVPAMLPNAAAATACFGPLTDLKIAPVVAPAAIVIKSSGNLASFT